MRFLLLIVIFASQLLVTPLAHALTIAEFRAACNAFSGNCNTHPTLQAYVGGALDLFASLDENTPYLNQINCPKMRAYYDVGKIITFMQKADVTDKKRNAMTLFINYFEVNGKCRSQN